MSWDRRWMQLAKLISDWSKDRSTKNGAVIVDSRNVVVSLGWNGFPRNINDDVEERHQRPEKYMWAEHAERNAIYNAAAKGHPLLGCRMYIWSSRNLFSCADCARAIIQSGISHIIITEPEWSDENWAEQFKVASEMLDEAGIVVKFYREES